jgi:glycosyltransferase involved in cell wall biosynthesis
MNKKVIFRFFPRDFTVAAYQQANLFLFPSNIECSPIVLFECAAAGLPFLATDVGNSVEIAGWTGGGKILPTDHTDAGFSFANVKESAKVLYHLYLNEQVRKKMSEHSHDIWKRKYTWEKITLQYEELYLSLAGMGKNAL